MTEKQFDDLTNLYLDHEIGRNELRDLKDAIRHNVLRRRKFERACEVHQAARKALATRAGAREAGDGNGSGASFPPVAPTPSAAAHGLSRPRGARSAGVSPGSAQQKQSQAHRNASVTTLAERQLHKGAASAVDLRKISLESRRASSSAGGRRHIFSFFDSPAGMMIGGLLLGLAGVGMYFALKFTMPDENDDGSVKNPAVHLSDVVIDPKVLKELAADQKNQPPAEDAARARLYQAALTGQPVTATPSANDDASPPTLATNSAAAAGPTSTGPALPAPPVALPLANPDSYPANLTVPAILSAPGANALAPSQDPWVQLSMPSPLPPAPSLDDKNPPANQTTMPVMLP